MSEEKCPMCGAKTRLRYLKDSAPEEPRPALTWCGWCGTIWVGAAILRYGARVFDSLGRMVHEDV